MYCLVIGGNYLPITARPSERGRIGGGGGGWKMRRRKRWEGKR